MSDSYYPLNSSTVKMGLPWWLSGKRICLWFRRHGFDAWVGKIPWRRKWQLTPVLLPGEFHGQRSLAGCSPWGHRVGHDLVTDSWFPCPIHHLSPHRPTPTPALLLNKLCCFCNPWCVCMLYRRHFSRITYLCPCLSSLLELGTGAGT